MTSFVCECCRQRIERDTPYKLRVRAVLLKLKLRYIIENPGITARATRKYAKANKTKGDGR